MKLKYLLALIPFLLLSCKKSGQSSATEDPISKQISVPVKDYQYCKRTADSIFSVRQNSNSFTWQKVYEQTDNDDKPRAAVFIGNLFDVNERHALVLHSSSDTTFEVNVLRWQNEVWTSVWQQAIIHYDLWLTDDFIHFTDLNGDKLKDLLITTSVIQFRASSELFNAWLFNNSTLTPIEGFDQYPNIVVDEDGKSLYSYIANGCADMTMSFQTLTIENNSAQLIKQVLCDCCTEVGDSCTIQIDQQKKFKVIASDTYKHVPPFYREFLKNKLSESIR